MSYESTLGGITSVIVVTLVFSTAITALRIAARQKQRIGYGADDIFAVLAWLVFIGSNAVAIYNITLHMLGYPTPKDKADLKVLVSLDATSTQAFIAGIICAILTLGFARLSAVFFFRRIFCTRKQGAFNTITNIMIGIISLWMIGFFLSTMLACGSDFSFYWNPKSTVVCTIYANQKGIAASSFLLDFIVLVLPLPQIWSLHTTPARKAAICAVFLTALVGLGSSCARMIMLFQIEDAGTSANNQDPLEANTKNYFYQLLEQGCCLIAINMPSIWYFVRGMSPDRVLRSFRSLVSIRSTASQDNVEKHSAGTSQNESLDFTNNETTASKRAQIEQATELQASE